jgi:FkbM family methyltransferase
VPLVAWIYKDNRSYEPNCNRFAGLNRSHMLSSDFRESMKRYLPALVWRIAGRAERYLSRLIVWGQVMRQIRGADRDSSQALWSAFLWSPVSSLTNLDQWRDPVVGCDAKVEVPNIGRFNIRANSDDLYHLLRTRERAVFETISNVLRPGDCFVDAGANIGFYSVMAASKVGLGGRVIAVEMMPDTAAILRKHARLNGASQIEVVETALLDRAGGHVTAHVIDGKFGQASISGSGIGRAVNVEASTIDDVLRNVPVIRLLKMDLEGAEELALRGAQESLERIGAVIFERWTRETNVSRLLVARGFNVQSLDGRNMLAVRI